MDMKTLRRNLLIIFGLIFAVLASVGIRSALAQTDAAPIGQASALHPTFALLDKDDENVLKSGTPVSTMKTCGQCHDTDFIQKHAFHSDLGLGAYTQDRELNSSNGMFGQWDPLTYRFLSQKGDDRLDLSTAEWLEIDGNRVVGGGPATTSRAGTPLTSLKADPKDPETSILNKNGSIEA